MSRCIDRSRERRARREGQVPPLPASQPEVGGIDLLELPRHPEVAAEIKVAPEQPLR